MNLTDYWANKLFDFQFRAATLSKPTGWWWALFTVAPTAAGGGTEATGGSYARVSIAPSDTNWYSTQGGTSGNSSGTTQATSNAVVLTFPTPTASWGEINGAGLFDAATVGNLCFWLDFAIAGIDPITVNAGEGAIYLPAGAASISFGA